MPVNFNQDPSGGSKMSGGPGVITVSRDQKSGEDSDLSTAEIPPGGKDLRADPKPDTGNPIGTTAGNGGRKPFRLDGGG